MPTAILPAAGASLRMGHPKLLLPFGATTVVGSLVATLREAGVAPVVLVTAPGPPGDALRGWAAAAGLLTTLNPAPEHGMLSSILAGLDALGGVSAFAAGGDILLVSPADLPALRASTITLLLDAMASSGSLLAFPTFQDRHGHPLAIASCLVPEIPLLDPTVGLRQLRDRHASSLLEIPGTDSGCVADLDTPEDYDHLTRSLLR